MGGRASTIAGARRGDPRGAAGGRGGSGARASGDLAEGSAEEELLEVLSILADDYESKHFPIAAPDPIEAIKLRMEE